MQGLIIFLQLHVSFQAGCEINKGILWVINACKKIDRTIHCAQVFT